MRTKTKKRPAATVRWSRLSRADFWLGALLLCVTLAVYSPALNGGILWDDEAHLTKPELQSWHGLWRIWSEPGATQQYYPLLHSAFWAEHKLWGDAVFGYHLTNVLLHATAALLVVIIVRRLSIPGAWLAGFLFALHPVCVEAVAWMSEQKSTLSIVFYLGALLAYLHFDQTRRKSQYALALGLFMLALLSKTVTATLPAALLVIFWWQRKRLDWKRDVLPLAPWLVLGATAGLFTAWVERKFIGAEGAEYALTLAQRGLLAGRVIWFYLIKLLWPVNLIFIYPHWTVDPAVWWQYLFPLGILALAAVLLFAARRHRGPLAGFLFFAGTLFPVLGFFNVYPFRFSYVADHFQYVASLGVIVPLAAGLTLAAGRIPAGGRPVALGLVLAVLGALTLRQSSMYKDGETIYRETLRRNPACWMALNNLGMILAKSPARLPEAIADYEAALRLKSDSAEAHTDLGNALMTIPGRESEAIAHFEEAVRISPNLAIMHYNLGVGLSKTPDRLPEAMSEWRTALRIRPDTAQAHYNLGVALAKIPGRLPEAISEYQAELRIQPEFALAHLNMGSALAEIPGRLPEAIAEYQAALRIAPEDAGAHYSLGLVLSRIPGRLPEAVSEYQAAIRIMPDYADAHTSLGLALAQIPERMPEAISEFQAAVRIHPNSAEAHSNLGVALSRAPGRLAEAISEFEASYRIRPDPAIAQTIDRLRAAGRN